MIFRSYTLKTFEAIEDAEISPLSKLLILLGWRYQRISRRQYQSILRQLNQLEKKEAQK